MTPASTSLLTIEHHGSTCLVRLPALENFPESVTEQMEQDLANLIRQNQTTTVVISFAGVTLVSSYMLGVLVRLLALGQKKKVGLHLAELSDLNARLFQMTRLDSKFRISASEQEALALALAAA